MGRNLHMLLGAITVSAALLGTAKDSGAKAPALTTDRVIYGQGNAIWSIASDGSSASVLVPLSRPASEVSRIKVSASGTAMLVTIAGVQAWVDLSSRTKPASLRPLPCAIGPDALADISPDGRRILCATQVPGRIAVYQMRPTIEVQIIERAALGAVFFAGDQTIGFGEKSTLIDLETGNVLADHRPDREMMISPNGARAIGAYDEGDIDVVYAFRLDGKAVKRTLMQAARAVSISTGSKWASLQQEVDACAVRMAGGQYMCWRRFEAMEVSSHARNMLLSSAGEQSGHDLFLGSISGTSARKPTPLVQSVERAAAFWPDPAALKDTEKTSTEVHH